MVTKKCFLSKTARYQIVNLYFSEGFKEAAEKFRLESGLQPSVELNTLDERIKIREAIQMGRIQDAISLVNDLHPELLDNERYLYFHLQVCNFCLLNNVPVLYKLYS